MRGKDFDKELPRAILAYMCSPCKSGPGHFASRTSIVNQRGSSMKNEGPSCDVIENTWPFQTRCHPSCDVQENKGITELSPISLKINEMFADLVAENAVFTAFFRSCS